MFAQSIDFQGSLIELIIVFSVMWLIDGEFLPRKSDAETCL